MGKRRGLPDINPSVTLVQVLCSDAMRGEEKRHAMVRQEWQREWEQEQERKIDVPCAATDAMGASDAASHAVSKAVTGRRSRTGAALLVLLMLLLGLTSAWSQAVTCRPVLSTKVVQEARPSFPQVLPWRWQATIVADASFCATRSGQFEMDFIRLKENAPDLQFTQAFRWTESQFEISMELSSDEAIAEFRIGFIAPCVCAETGRLLSNARTK